MAINVYELVTNRIIEQLEKGVVPWERPWTGVRAGAYNRISKKPYSLLNQMILKHSGEYATFKQWSEIGGKVRKGEKAEIIVFWKVYDKTEKNDKGEDEKKTYCVLKYYNVFHISQVEGVEPLKKPFAEVEPIEAADKVIKDYVTRENITFIEQARARMAVSTSLSTQVRVISVLKLRNTIRMKHTDGSIKAPIRRSMSLSKE